MNWNQLQRKWRQCTHQLREKWNALTDDNVHRPRWYIVDSRSLAELVSPRSPSNEMVELCEEARNG